MAANNYFKKIRKSYTTKIFISVFTNLVTFGQPAQQMILDHYNSENNTEIENIASPVSEKRKGITKKSDTSIEKQQVKRVNQYRANRTPEEKASANTYYAIEQKGIIGKLFASEAENPLDNFFTVNLPEDIDLQNYDALLIYDLYGLAEASQTTKSINNNPAYGGKIMAINDKWETVREPISISHLQAGDNEIFFNRRMDEQYQYRISNLRIELTEKISVFSLADNILTNYNGSINLVGSVSAGIKAVEAYGEPISISNTVFEKVLHDIPANTKELEIVLTDSKGERKAVNYPVQYQTKDADFQFEKSIITSTGKLYDLGKSDTDLQSYHAVNLNVKPIKKNTGSSIFVQGLEFKDVKTLENEVVNVTAENFFGYRIKKINLPDSVAVSLHLKYDPEKIPEGYTAKDIKTFYYDSSERSWKVLQVDSLNYKKNEIISILPDNDTDYINGVIKVPESPETGSFAPTAITDMKVADPAAGVVSIPPPSPNSTGSASTSFPIKLPQGRNGIQPSLAVTYNSEAGNGWMGLGWNLATEAITLNTKWGVPTFNGTYESELYSLNGADLVLKNGSEYTNPHRDANITRGISSKTFYMRKEGGYQRIIRRGTSPSNYWWEVTDKQGNKSFYGGVTAAESSAVIKTPDGKIAHWALRRIQDTYGNYIEYNYTQSASSYTIPGTAIPAKEFYINSIRYTRHASLSSSYYEISFKRNSYTLAPAGSATRSDIVVNARNGFVQVIDDLLTEIHISFKQSGQSLKRIRSYRFDYEEGPFKKQQLSRISEFDTGNKLFYSNTMEYYDEIGTSPIISSSANSWSSSVNDNLTSDFSLLPGADLSVVPNGSVLGTSTASGFSAGLRAGIGIGADVTNIKNTVGASFGYSQNNQKTQISFIDLNGDGLPDKVLNDGNNNLRYRPNTGSGFGNMIDISGTASLSTTSSRTTSFGADANALGLIGAGKSWSTTKATTDKYFCDFNGDGLPDIISGGRVRFNTTPNEANSWERNLSIYPASSENPIESGAVSNEIIPFLELETMDELREQHPQFDHVKVWQAPYTGEVTIESIAKLVHKNTDGSHANEFRVTIERANFNQSGDFAIPIASSALVNQGQQKTININSLDVTKGDLFFFRVHNTDYGFGGEVEWNPRITYTYTTVLPYENLSDENDKYLHVYDAESDFVVNNDQGISPQNGDGSVTLRFRLSTMDVDSYDFSDDIKFVIKKKRINLADGSETTSPSWVWSRTYDQETGNFSGTETISSIPVSNPQYYRDVFYYYAESTSNVDWGAIEWKPQFAGNISGTRYPGVNYITYDNNVNQVKYWMDYQGLPEPEINSSLENDDPFLMVHHNMENLGSSFLNQFANEDFPLEINWVVKEEADNKVKTAHSKTFYIYRTSPSGSGWNYKYTKSENPNDLLDWQNSPEYANYIIDKQRVKEIKNGYGKIFSAFYIDDEKFGINNTASIYINLVEDEVGNYPFTPVTIGAPFIATTPSFYGYSYRGWGQFLYNSALEFPRDEEGNIIAGSNPTYFDGPINIRLLDFESQADGVENIDPENQEASLAGVQAGAIRFSFYNQKNQELQYINESIVEAQYGFNSNDKLTATIGRFAEDNLYDIYVDPNDITLGGAGIFVGMKQRSKSKGSAVSGNLSAVNGTKSEALSQVLNQYMDLNGDRYPDIVSGKIQYTNMLGGLSTIVKDSDFMSGDESEDLTANVSIPAIQPNSTDGKSQGNKTNTNVNAGINNSTGKSFNSRLWSDMNGDGLPDKVELRTNGENDSKVEVWLNTGYGFSSTSIIWGDNSLWGSLVLLTSTRGNTGIGPSFNFGASFALGFGAAISTANIGASLFDVNGDGLPELVFKDSSSYKYYLNTGKGFSGPARTFYSALEMEKDVTVSGNVFGSFTSGFSFPTFIGPVKIVFSPTASVNASFNEKRNTVQDFDGDGLCDVVWKGNDSNNSSLSYRRNRVGKTHLLKLVHTPLGGNWTIGYERSENSYKMPGSKWLLTEIETNDGFAEDDDDYRPNAALSTVVYEKPNYDRREREFLGFEKVTTQQIGNDDNIYRYVTTSYHNENYYLSGAQKASAVYDAQGHIVSEKKTLYNLLDPDNTVVNFNASAENHFMQADLISNAEEFLDKSRLFIAIARVTTTSYEQADGLSAVTEFLDYDNFGNLTSYKDYGEGGDDTFRSDIEYYTSVTGVENSIGFPKRIRVYKDNSNTLLRERSAIYNSKGKLSRVTTRLDENSSSVVNRVSFTYDSTFGNLTRVNHLDNLNEQQSTYYYQSIAYDNIVRTYPVQLSNSFGESSTATYNYLFGVPVFTTDMNGASMRTRIDNRGRILEVTGPNELATESNTSAWTIRMEYKGEDPITGNLSPTTYMYPAKGNFAAVNPGTTPPDDKEHFAITRHFDPEYIGQGNNQLLTINIVDGFGQPIQVKKTHLSGNTMKWLVSGFEEKDVYGRTIKTYLPTVQPVSGSLNFYSLGSYCTYLNISPSSLEPPLQMTYDERDRTTSVKQPGESQTAQIEYDLDGNMFVQKVTNELSQTISSYTDIRGRNRKTVQNEEITTLFDYNAINELVKVTNNEGFMTEYFYDMAGRKTKVQHPDRGVQTFKYDKAGNIIEQSNSNLILAGGQKITYRYNFGRLMRVEYPQTPQNEVIYKYGQPNDPLAEELNAVGRLLYQEDASGVQLFGYGLMGEVTKNLRSVATAGYQSFWFYTEWEYDSWNRVQEITYPDREVVSYNYNKVGMLRSVTSTLDNIEVQPIVKSINYNDLGERSYITYGNDSKTTYEYDTRRRMSALSHSFTNLQITNKYDYDVLSNIVGITNQDPSSSLPGQGHIGGPVRHEYTYDDYNRLSYARGSYTGSGDMNTPYLQQDYELQMKYNTDHTIQSKTQIHRQGMVSSYGGNVSNEIVVYKNSYDLKYGEYASGAYVAGDYGYQQPHAPRQIIEYPSWVINPTADDPRTKSKQIEYDANGNQTEITQKVGELEISVRQNLWDEENRLRGVDLKPDDETDHPIAVYTYDAGGARTARYNLDRIDVFSNAKEVGQAKKDNVMIYPNGLIMGKATEEGLDENRLTYTKHYYVGSERISAKTGTILDLGLYPATLLSGEIPALTDHEFVRTPSDQSVSDAEDAVTAVYTAFEQSPPGFSSFRESDKISFRHDERMLNTFYFHKDHLGSSSYISNAAGNVTQHMEYLPFGETLVDEHTNSFNSPFKYNGKEYDEETGNYYYSARYYDPKLSIFISVDPLAEETLSSYTYCYNNPIILTDPTGMSAEQSSEGFPPLIGYLIAKDYEIHDAGELDEVIINASPSSSSNNNQIVHAIADATGGSLAVQTHQEAKELSTRSDGSIDHPAYAAHTLWLDKINNYGGDMGSAATPNIQRRGFVIKGKTSWAKTSGILRDAAKRKGNYGLGSGTFHEAIEAGKSWVGEGFTVSKDGSSWISKNGLRQFRPPSFKPKLGIEQANFQWRNVNKGAWQSNGHLDIIN